MSRFPTSQLLRRIYKSDGTLVRRPNAHGPSNSFNPRFWVARPQFRTFLFSRPAKDIDVEDMDIWDDFAIEKDPMRIDYPSDLRVLMSIPPRIVGQPPDPDGHAECLLYGAAKSRIVKHPDYPKPLPKPIGDSPPYVVKQTRDMGLGLFTARDILPGELVIAERPLLVVPMLLTKKMNPFSRPDAPMELAHRWLTQAFARHEMELELALRRMSSMAREAFLSLYISDHRPTGSDLSGIIETNAIRRLLFFGDLNPGRMAALPGATEPAPDQDHNYLGVFNFISRMNHSCSPNVLPMFDTPSLSLQFFAPEKIKSGEQIFRHYSDLSQPYNIRQAALSQRFGIWCSCPACTNATPASDKLRITHEQRFQDYFRGWHSSRTSRQPSIPQEEGMRHLNPMLRLRQQLAEEGLTATPTYGMLCALIATVYEKMGMKKTADKYMEIFEGYAGYFEGLSDL